MTRRLLRPLPEKVVKVVMRSQSWIYFRAFEREPVFARKEGEQIISSVHPCQKSRKTPLRPKNSRREVTAGSVVALGFLEARGKELANHLIVEFSGYFFAGLSSLSIR